MEELELVKAIKKDSDWRAKLALLERKWPKHYAPKQIMVQGGLPDKPATTDSSPAHQDYLSGNPSRRQPIRALNEHENPRIYRIN